MQARAAIENEAEILKCEHHGLAHLKRCLHPQGYRGAIIKTAAWKDTLGTSGSSGRANITGVATGSRNRLPTEARTGTRPSWYQAQPVLMMVLRVGAAAF